MTGGELIGWADSGSTNMGCLGHFGTVAPEVSVLSDVTRVGDLRRAVTDELFQRVRLDGGAMTHLRVVSPTRRRAARGHATPRRLMT